MNTFHITVIITPPNGAPAAIVPEGGAWYLPDALSYVRRHTLTQPAGTEIELKIKVIDLDADLCEAAARMAANDNSNLRTVVRALGLTEIEDWDSGDAVMVSDRETLALAILKAARAAGKSDAAILAAFANE